jgi:hypothetical protein
MGRITIGNGRWTTIRGYLNSMFSELYNGIGGGGGSVGVFQDTLTINGGIQQRITTDLVIKPKTVQFLDEQGYNATHTINWRVVPNGLNYAIDVYSLITMENVELTITY